MWIKNRFKCFNCEILVHVQRDCQWAPVIRQKVDTASGWKDSDVVRKLTASRATHSSSEMSVVEAYLEVDRTCSLEKELNVYNTCVLKSKI